MADGDKRLCYNKGCGAMFDMTQNTDDSCTYHSGAPYFHDAYKEWTCCHKRSTDFTEFLNVPGCTKGRHSDVRPPVLDKPKEENKLTDFLEKALMTEVVRRTETRRDLPLVPVRPTVSPHVKVPQPKVEPVESKTVQIGTPCLNTGCRVTYSSTMPACVYHPGEAIFHEGLKYWSCCRKRTSDFNQFLGQVGCETGEHRWFKDRKEVQCRLDWHQTDGLVYVSIFARNYHPYESAFEVSPTRLKLNITFPEDDKTFERDIQLYGSVSVDECKVSMLPSKIEVRLVKAENVYWKSLSVSN